MALDHNGESLALNDKVIVLGKVTAIASGIHDVINVEVTMQGQTITLTFYSSDLRKASISDDTITGALGNPT